MVQQQLPALVEGQARELGDQPLVESVDGEPGQTVAFAEDQPVGILGRTQAKRRRPEPDGGLELVEPESGIERLRLPSIKSQAQTARGVVQASGDEGALVTEEVNLVAQARSAFDRGDRVAVDPRDVVRRRDERAAV